jgi:hypothetical protein
MQSKMKLSVATLSIVAGLAACAGSKATNAASQADFKADLQLASSTTMNLASPKVDPALLNSLETSPLGAPQAAKTVKKGAGNRSVRSHSPTVRATPEMDVAAVDENSDQVDVVTQAPAPESTEPVAVAPRPTPAPVVVQAGNGSGDYGTSGNGGGIFGPGGGIGGVVIRGGGVDGDHCQPHGRGTMRGPVYIPSTGEGYPRTGGITISRSGIGGGLGGVSRTSAPARGGVGMRRGR